MESRIYNQGDYEIYHANLVNARRQEFGVDYPVVWKVYSVEHKVDFHADVKRAVLIPAAVAESPPESIPSKPSESIASFTPLPIVAPKPIRGVETPQPKISYKGS